MVVDLMASASRVPTQTRVRGLRPGLATGGARAAVVHRVDGGDNEVSFVITA
jgi:hypothetical protein